MSGTSKRPGRRALLALALVLPAAVGLGIGAAALRLASGPIDLSGFSDTVRDAVAGSLPPDHQVALGALNLEWAREGLSVRVHDFTVRDPQGRAVMTASAADVGLDPASLLLGRVAPRSLVVRQPSIGLVVRTDGSITPGEVPRAGEDQGTVSLFEALPAPAGAGVPALPTTMPAARGALERLVLDDVRLAVLDERTNRRRVALPFDVTFRRSGAAFDLTVAGGAGAGWSISAHLVDGAAGRSAQLRVAGFDIARLSPDPGPPLPVALSLSAPIDAAGTLGRAEGEATVGAFDVDVDGAPARIDPGRFAVAFDPAARAFTLGPATLRSGGAQMRVRIEGRLPAPGDPTGAVRLTLAGDDVALADGFRTPALARLAANATYEARDRRLWIDRFTMGPAEGAPIVEGQLGLGLFGRSPEVRLAARAAGLDAAMVKAAWPPSLNRDLRGWVMDNVVAGRLDSAEVEMAVPNDWMADRRPLRDDMFRGRYVVSQAIVRATADLPPIEGLSGTIVATGNTSRVDARGGTMTLAAGALTLSAGAYVCDDIQAPRATCTLSATAAGPIGAHLEAADRQGNGVVRAGGFDTRALGGEGTAQLRLTLPIGVQNRTTPPLYQIDAEFRQVAGRGVVEGYDLERGALRLRAENRGFEAQGTAQVGGLPVRLSGRAETGRRTVLRAEADTTDEIRKRFGIDLGEWMTGPAQLRFIKEIATAPPFEAIRRVEADLTQARLNLLPLAFDKPRGTPATLGFTLRETPRATILEDASLSGRGFQLRGRVTLDADGAPSIIDLTEVRLRPDDAFAARWEREANRQTVRVTGRSLDARPFLSRIFSDVDVTAPAVEGDQRARLDLSIRVERLLGANGAAIGDARLDMTRQGAQITALNIGGSLGGAARLTGQTLSDQGRPYLMISATDGGALLRFADLYRNMSGGRLTLTQTLTDPTARSADGVLFVQDFRIVNDPTFERLFGAASGIEADGTARPRARGPESAEIDRLRVVFTRADGITQIREGSMRNPLLGLTFDGRVDFRRDRLELKGIAIPMFALNNLLARVPIIGAFLGGQDGGLWGITYQVTGTVAQPQLAINPVSAIAPGFLRNLFQFQDPPAPGQR